MSIQAFVILIVNAFAYIFLFTKYQLKKKKFDIGSIILLTWVIGSFGSLYFYTFPVTYLSYYKITFLPLLYMFLINYTLFSPFLKTKYDNICNIKVYNLRKVFHVLSFFFGIVGILPFINCLIKLPSFSMGGAILADMYSSEEDKATLIFLPAIKPFYSILRHFSVFIIFLFFYNLTLKNKSKFIITGLCLSVLTFFMFAVMAGNRGGIISVFLTCAYFILFMKNLFSKTVYSIITKIALTITCCLFLGIAAISISRLTDMSDKKGKALLMDEWISQYAGEGIIRFDNTIWYLENHMNGYQNLPTVVSVIDSSIKDLDKYSAKADGILKTPCTVFYTYIGDLVIDFGLGGTVIAVLILWLFIKYLIKIRNHSISFYHIIFLSYFYIYLSIGFTANIYRTYYTQLSIVEVSVLLGLIYIFQKINERIYANRTRNRHSGIQKHIPAGNT